MSRRILQWSCIALVALAACSRPPRATVTEPVAAPEELEYEVREGDTWARVSEAFFGDATRADRIATDNGFHPAIDPVEGVRVRVVVLPDEIGLVRGIAEARGAYNAGVDAMSRTGGDADARSAFERALERAPHFVDARYNLGLVLIRLGEPHDAQRHLEQVVRARDTDAEAWYALSAARFHAGDYAAALPGLERSIELDPHLLRARWTHALCLQRMGRGEESIAAWRKYLELDSTSAWADQARQHLAELGA